MCIHSQTLLLLLLLVLHCTTTAALDYMLTVSDLPCLTRNSHFFQVFTEPAQICFFHRFVGAWLQIGCPCHELATFLRLVFMPGFTCKILATQQQPTDLSSLVWLGPDRKGCQSLPPPPLLHKWMVHTLQKPCKLCILLVDVGLLHSSSLLVLTKSAESPGAFTFSFA